MLLLNRRKQLLFPLAILVSTHHNCLSDLSLFYLDRTYNSFNLFKGTLIVYYFNLCAKQFFLTLYAILILFCFKLSCFLTTLPSGKLFSLQIKLHPAVTQCKNYINSVITIMCFGFKFDCSCAASIAWKICKLILYLQLHC